MTAGTHADTQETARLYEALYVKHARPLEAHHPGAYLAVSRRGKTILGSTLLEVAERAKTQLGPGSFIFKIGDRAVGRWRRAVVA